MGHGVSLLILYCTPSGTFLTWKRAEKQNETKKNTNTKKKNKKKNTVSVIYNTVC